MNNTTNLEKYKLIKAVFKYRLVNKSNSQLIDYELSPHNDACTRAFYIALCNTTDSNDVIKNNIPITKNDLIYINKVVKYLFEVCNITKKDTDKKIISQKIEMYLTVSRSSEYVCHILLTANDFISDVIQLQKCYFNI